MEPNIKREYYPDGQIRMETPWVNGNVHGIGKIWFANGNLSSSVVYVNGIRNGSTKWFGYESGEMQLSMFFINGNVDGECIDLKGFIIETSPIVGWRSDF